MRLESAKWHNMGPHRDWSVHLMALPPEAKLVAFVGKNGKGKSFSLESAVAGGCYREMPTQGSVVSRATAADSWQESTICFGGRRYKIKHLVNAAAAKRPSETSVTVDDGTGRFVPAYEGGTGSKLFGAWAAKHLPDPDVLFASIFASQQSEGFVKMMSGERIGIILRVIGVARFERMAAGARKRRDAAAQQLDGLVKRLADIRGGSKPVALCEAELDAAIGAVVVLREESARCDGAVRIAKELDAQARVVEAERAAAVRELADLQQQLGAVQQKREPVAVRVANNRAVLADAESIRSAVARSEAIRLELVSADAACVAAKAELDAVMAPWADVNQRLAAEQARFDRAASRLRDAAAVQAAKSELVALRDAAEEAEAEVTRLTAKLDELTAAHLAGADERVVAAIASHKAIVEAVADSPDTDPDDLAGISREAIDSDACAVATAETHPALTQEARGRCDVAKARHAYTRRQLDTAERLAARGPEVDAAGVEKQESEAELQRLRAGLAAADIEAKLKSAAHSAAVDKAEALRVELQQLAERASRAAPLANAETRLAEIVPQLEAFDAEIARIEGVIAARPPLPVVPDRPDLVLLEGQAERAVGALLEGQRGIIRAEQALEFARGVEAKAASLEAERASVEFELTKWTRSALDWGRDGVQSAEVDSAGPELTELINDLLRTCHGPRFTVSVETQRLNADGKKTIDECTIRVIDTVAGTDKEIREHSGGERVILGEAVSLALTMLACRRAGWERPTLIRDESAAALDPGNAKAWVAMMRRAVEITKADRLLFVSHSQEVIEMADYQIEVGEPQQTEARAA